MAVTGSGLGYVWGLDSWGQIHEANVGSPMEQYEIIPEPTLLPHTNIVQFSIGTYNGTAIDKDGNTYMWGDNSIGQIIDPIKVVE